jgi:membrane protein YqaA with SNARE-associated domain
MDEIPVAKASASFMSVPLIELPKTLLSLLALLLITLGSFWAALNPGWIQTAGHWGYLGAAVISFLSSATVILPAPGLAVVFSMGGALNPVLLGILAGIGSGLGELSGYAAGASGRALISSNRVNPLLERFTTRHTAIALFVLAILPLPVFDFAGIAAGAMRIRIPVFLASVISGKIIKHVLIAFMGAGFLPVLRYFFGW